FGFEGGRSGYAGAWVFFRLVALRAAVCEARVVRLELELFAAFHAFSDGERHGYSLLRGFAPGTGGIVVGIGRGLGGTEVFRHMAQVHANAVPDVARAAHAVDEDVVDGEVFCRFRVRGFPAL